MATNVHLFKFLFLLLFFSSFWTPHGQQILDSLKPGDMLTSSSRPVSSKQGFTLIFTWSGLFERNCTSLVISSNEGSSKTYLWFSGANDSEVPGLENNAGALIIRGQGGNLTTLTLPRSLQLTLSLLYWILAISSSRKCTPMDLQSGCYGKVLIIQGTRFYRV